MPRFIVVVALVNAIVYHRPLYAFAIAHLDLGSMNGVLALVTVLFLATLGTVLILTLLSLISQRLLKPVCMLLAVGNAVALYFVETYGVVLDKPMIGNVLATNFAESVSFLHPKLLLYLLLYGALPCALLWKVRIRRTPLLRRLAFLVVALLVGVGWIYAQATTWLWIDKNSKSLGGMTMPWSYVIGTVRIFVDHLEASRKQTLLPAGRFLTDEKRVVVLVIGESARARNFSLYGYGRPTNPQLAGDGVVALANTQACATYTSASVACMLSPYSTGWSLRAMYEPLPSYLQRHGVDVVWRTNNWGEPPITVRTYERAEDIPGACSGSSCHYDEALLHGLDERIRSSTSNRIFVVLHQHGSHGPDYFNVYPAGFEAFTPTCRSVELHRCTEQELVNAYDNTILYTDDFLHRTIELLREVGASAVMLYISDHGESLGEYGLYLHGTPYSVSPDVQKDVPFLVWMSDRFQQETHVTIGSLTDQPRHSDANVFHSVMGAFGMRSDAYDPRLDIFGDGPITSTTPPP